MSHNTRGPVASICYQGLMRIDEGIDVVERSSCFWWGLNDYLEKDVLGLHCSSQWLRLWDSWVL